MTGYPGPTNGPTLREYIDKLFGTHESAHDDHERFHAREHEFAQRAIDKASELADANKADANEWRSAMNDRERNFPTRIELSAVSEKVDKLEDAEIRRAEKESIKDKEQSRQQWLIGLAVLIASISTNLIIRLLGT